MEHLSRPCVDCFSTELDGPPAGFHQCRFLDPCFPPHPILLPLYPRYFRTPYPRSSAASYPRLLIRILVFLENPSRPTARPSSKPRSVGGRARGRRNHPSLTQVSFTLTCARPCRPSRGPATIDPVLSPPTATPSNLLGSAKSYIQVDRTRRR